MLRIKKLSFASGLKQYSLKVTQTCSNIFYYLAVHTLKWYAIWREYIVIEEYEKHIWENLIQDIVNASCLGDEN